MISKDFKGRPCPYLAKGGEYSCGKEKHQKGIKLRKGGKFRSHAGKPKKGGSLSKRGRKKAERKEEE